VMDLDQLEAKLDLMDQQINEEQKDLLEDLAVIKDEEDIELIGEDQSPKSKKPRSKEKKVEQMLNESIERSIEVISMSVPMTPESLLKKSFVPAVIGSKERLKNLQKIEDRSFKLESEFIFKDRSASLGKAVNPMNNESILGPTRKNTSFRIKPMNSLKESPLKNFVDKADYDEQKMNILKNFASYLSPEKGESAYESIKKHYYRLNNVQQNNAAEEDSEEKFISIKRIPIRGPVLSQARNTEYNNWPSPSKLGNLSTLDIQGTSKNPSVGNSHVIALKNTGRNEYNSTKTAKTRGFSPVYQKGRNVGVYVAPKTYELHLNLSSTKDESMTKNQISGTGLSINGVGTSGKIYSKIMTQQREQREHHHHQQQQHGHGFGYGHAHSHAHGPQTNLSPFMDSQLVSQKYHNFLTNIKK